MSKKILIVDDDEGYLLAAGKLLEGEGYTVSKATNASEARRSLESKQPDLILLDVLMPGQDGFAFADEISKEENISDIPIVLVTSVADSPGRIMHAFEKDKGCTVSNILPKSDADEHLVTAVREALTDAQC